MKHTINNRTRKLGWGYTCWTKPGDIPTRPDYTGTIKQILDTIGRDKTYHSMKSGGTYLSESWFYDGKRIISVNGFTLSSDIDYWICGLFNHDSMTGSVAIVTCEALE